MLLAALVAVLFAAPPLVMTAVVYAAARGRRADCDASPPLSAGAAALAFAHEWLASMALLIALPLRARPTAAGAAPGRIAVLIPELRSSGHSFWYLRRRLHAAGWRCVAGLPRTRSTSASEAIATLDACMAQLPSATDLVLVGHGIGGLLAHRYAQERPGVPIRHVVTLAAPHRGSHALPYRLLCRAAGPALGPQAVNPADVDVIAIYSGFDAWLLPIDDAYCPGGFNVDIRGIGHCAMLFSRRVADLVVENIAALAPVRSPLDQEQARTDP